MFNNIHAEERRQKRRRIFTTVIGFAVALILGVLAWDLFYLAQSLEIIVGVLIYAVSFIFASVSLFITYLITCEVW